MLCGPLDVETIKKYKTKKKKKKAGKERRDESTPRGIGFYLKGIFFFFVEQFVRKTG